VGLAFGQNSNELHNSIQFVKGQRENRGFSLLLGGLLGWGSWGWSWSLDWGLGDWLGFLLLLEGEVELGLLGSLLLLEVLGEELLISDAGLFAGLPSVLLDLLVEGLSSDSLLGDESLDLWGLEEGLVASLDFSSDNVLGHIVLLSEGESLSDGVGSLWSKSSWSLDISEAGNLTVSLLEDLEGDDRKVWSTDASSDGLSLSLTSSSWSVKGHS